MIASGLIGVVCGLLLGLRFKVLVLVPPHLGALVIATVLISTGHVLVFTACAGFLLWSVMLQLGYLCAASRSLDPRPSRLRPKQA